MESQLYRLVLFVMLLLSQVAMAEPTPGPTAPTSVAAAIQPTSDSSQKEEILLLKAQLQTIREYEQQFLSVVLWSLGSIIALAVGLAAFNWYSSKISYERELEALSRENRGFQSELKALLQHEVDEKSSALIERLDSRQSAIESTVKKSLEKQLGELSSRIGDLKKSLVDLEYNDTERQAEAALTEKRYSWAIYKYAELILVSIRQGSDHYQATEIIDRIREILDKNNPSLSASDVSHAIESLKKLSGSLSAPAEGLIDVINRHYQRSSS